MEAKMNLYAGKLLVVDLTQKKITTEPLRQEWLKEFRGSWGLALRYYWDAVNPKVDPLSAENAVVIMTGTFTGTLVPMTSRTCLVSKSPLTGTVFESNIGGAFGPELKLAGYDGMIIKGKADSPVYLQIIDDQVTLESAEALMGKGIFETEHLLEKAIGSPEAKCLAIGPAGENIIPYAIIGSDAYRQFGRGGSGALFGSKNLKGVVCRGTGSIRVADMDLFQKTVTRWKQENLLSGDNAWVSTDGTPGTVDMTNEMGVQPTRNFTQGVNEKAVGVNGEAVNKAKIGDRACNSCPMACGKFTRINGAEMEGPEYETLVVGGSNCEINELEPVIRFNRLCDDLGLDTISCGATISMAMEMTEAGRADLGLRFGDAGEYLKIVSEIARLSTERGRDLALGSKKLAAKYRSADMSMEVKGLEMAAYEPRGNYGMGLAYATSERGACHLRAFVPFHESPFDLEVMSREVAAGQNHNGIKWSLGFCQFWGSLNFEIMADLLSAGLGEPVTVEDLAISGERIWNLSRLFNLRAGFTAKDDSLPEKVMKRKLEKGPHAGRVFSREDFETAKQNYYRNRGWDENGVPSQDKLAELSLDAL